MLDGQPNHDWQYYFPLKLHVSGPDFRLYDGSDLNLSIDEMVGLMLCLWLGFSCSGIQLYVLLSPHLCFTSSTEIRVRLVPSNLFKPSGNVLTDRSKAVLLLWIHFVICVCLCHTVLSVLCSLVVTYWARTDHLALLCVMFSCVFVSTTTKPSLSMDSSLSHREGGGA